MKKVIAKSDIILGETYIDKTSGFKGTAICISVWQYNNIRVVLQPKADKNGNLRIAYQTEENSYHARSFEDAFISLNFDFINENKINFNSLKNRDIINDEKDYYEIANKCIDKKSMFATEILYYSDDNYSEWEIPNYIKEGLLWLAK